MNETVWHVQRWHFYLVPRKIPQDPIPRFYDLKLKPAPNPNSVSQVLLKPANMIFLEWLLAIRMIANPPPLVYCAGVNATTILIGQTAPFSGTAAMYGVLFRDVGAPFARKGWPFVQDRSKMFSNTFNAQHFSWKKIFLLGAGRKIFKVFCASPEIMAWKPWSSHIENPFLLRGWCRSTCWLSKKYYLWRCMYVFLGVCNVLITSLPRKPLSYKKLQRAVSKNILPDSLVGKTPGAAAYYAHVLHLWS